MGRRKKGIPINGWLNIDKPTGMTSTQVIGRVRRILNAQKLGHAGTLDPEASGILPIALGEATKTIQYAQDTSKDYLFTVTWGEERNTDDVEGEIVESSDMRPSKQEIESLLPQFIGKIDQTPPKFSAIKIDGQRAYKLARKGEEVEIKSRKVEVFDLKLLKTTKNSADFEVKCGKGTYIRSIGRDLGRLLGCFGYISHLRRTSVGVFSESNAISLDKLEEMMLSSEPSEFLLPVEVALDDIPALTLTDDEAQKIRQGLNIRLLSRQDIDRLDIAGIDRETNIILAISNNKPLALLEKDGIELHSMRLFNL